MIKFYDMTKNVLVTPFLKWVGGKRQLINEIKDLLPKQITRYRYFEPFIGGGAVFFSLQPKHAVINDFNIELVNTYRVIRDNPDELIEELSRHKNDSEYFYYLRNLDRDIESFKKLSDIQRASRIIYLNKTCYNGLYRVNNAGEFNVPYGGYKNPNIVNAPVIKAVSKFLNKEDIQILNGDYEAALTTVDTKSFVYLDPPYHPIAQSSNFTGYIQGGWNAEEQIRLRDICNKLTQNGIKFLLSNSDCPFIREIYIDYNIKTVQAIRAINSNATKRGAVNEVLIKNY